MGSKQPDTVTQTNKVELSPEQQKLAKMALPYAQQFAGQQLQLPTGQGIAGFSPEELEAQQMALGQARGGMTNLANQAASTNQFLLDPSLLSPDSNPFLQAQGNVIQNQMTQNLTESVLPALRAGDVAAGGMNSGGNTRFAIASGLASGRNSQAIGDALTNLYGNAYQQGLQTMGQAAERVPSLQQSMLFPAAVVGGVGSQVRGLEQAQLDYTNNMEWLQQMLPMIQAQQLYGLVGSMPGGQGVSTVQGAQPSTNPIMGGLGGAAMGAQIGSIIPGVGTLAGAGLGALLGGGSAFL